MNLLVISDLHIGKNDNFDTFGWNSEEFIETIERIRKLLKIERIVLNGDIFELMKYKFEDIEKAYPKLLDYLNNDYFVHLNGNHDFMLENGKFVYEITNSNGKVIHIEHGHNADFLNGTKLGRLFGNIGFKILKYLTTFELVLKTYHKIVEFEDQVHRIPRKYDSVKYLQYALRVLKDSDLVVLAHTHKIEAHKTYYLNKKKRYLNCGSCSLGRLQAVIIDTETLKYETIKLNKKEKITNFLNDLEGNIDVPESIKNF